MNKRKKKTISLRLTNWKINLKRIWTQLKKNNDKIKLRSRNSRSTIMLDKMKKNMDTKTKSSNNVRSAVENSTQIRMKNTSESVIKFLCKKENPFVQDRLVWKRMQKDETEP